MKKIVLSLYILLCVCASIAPIQANTLKWLVTPYQYDKIEFYGEGIYKCHQEGRIGLIDDTGGEIPESNCDSITPCIYNGIALLLDNIGEQEAALIGIFNSRSRKVTLVERGRFIVKLDYAFFSNDRLLVKGSNGKWGYLDTGGNIAIPCEFIKALPFYINRAPVEVENNEWKYIKPNGKIAFIMNFKVSSATPFFNDSTAYVALNGNRKGAHINSKGQKLGKDIDREEFIKRSKAWLYNYRSIQEKELLQLTRLGKPEDFSIVGQSQLEVLQIQNEQAIVQTREGKMGILQLVQGDFILREPTKTSKTEKKKKQTIISMQLDVPAGLSCNDLTFEIDKGDGLLQEVDAKDYQISNDKKTITFEFPLSAKANLKNAYLRFVVKHHGLTIFNNGEIQVQAKDEPDPPVPDEKCSICGKQHNGKHQQCSKCGYYIGNVFPQYKCEGNGHHDQCEYPKCKKYKIKKCRKGYKNNQCPKSRGEDHPRPK